jgi:hypothetical protein
MQLSGSINLNGSLTGSILANNGLVSSSQQITNYYKFAETASANTFYGDQTITGSLAINDSATNFLIEGNLFSQTYLTSNGAIVLNPGYGGVEMVGSYRTFKATDITADGFVSGEIRATNNVVSSSQQITNYYKFAETASANTFYGVQTISGSFLVTGSTVQIGNNTLTGNTILSGSINVSGSTTFSGAHILSGSNTIGGNTIMTGTNTIIGDTVMSGSIQVSGSSNFHNSIFIVTGSTYFTGSHDVKGNSTITGSFNVSGNLNVNIGSAFYLWGNKLFNYGAFYDTTTQSGSANVSQSIQFNSIDYSQGVSITNNCRIVLANVGVYNIQFSAQLVDTASGSSTIHIWIMKNGVNVPNSAGKIFLKANEEVIASWNYVVPATSPNDYYELVWQSTDADARILYEVATGNIPAIPSIILTVTQVA